MNNNIIYFINKLSTVIVSQEFESDQNQRRIVKSDRFFNKCVKKVRQKGCDVLLNHSVGTPIKDPCITDYGGNWSPKTFLIDYGEELEAEGGRKYNELLKNCLQILEEKPYDYVNDMLKFLLLLKRPLDNAPSDIFQNDLTLNNSDFLLTGLDSLSSFLSENFSSEFVSKSGSFRKVPNSQESKTKHLDSKFQFTKNLLTPEKESLKAIFSSQLMTLSSKSHTNPCFSEFLNVRNYNSDKSLFSINESDSTTLLLDNFVDTPIEHKLPSMKFNLECWRSSSTRRSWDKSDMEVKSQLCEEHRMDNDSRKSSTIELKRNSICSHSFSTLFEKSFKEPTFEDRSCEFFESSKSKTDMKNKQTTSNSNSKEIILCLWEHEQSIIREFRPELADSFPALRMITMTDFVVDVKYLLTGVSSATFVFDTENQNFNMVYGTCLDDVTPESLYHFSKDFMEIGDCYTKLMSAIQRFGKNNFNNCTTVAQMFWKSIFEYLELHYSAVLEIPESMNLMALKSSTKDLQETIKTIAMICKVIGTDDTLPKGGELLSHLFSSAERIAKKSVVNIVFGILNNCCSVYYTCILQKWMFNGVLDLENDEFFVEYRCQKGRAYHNSFFLVEDKVPVFLKGFENSIFNCGKSVHLLKLLNVEDKFCQILEKGNYPMMKLCTTDDQLTEFKKKLSNYEDFIVKICGSRITIKQLNEEEKEKERIYQEKIRTYKILAKKKEEEEMARKLEEAKAMKEVQNKLLNEQRNAIDEEKERRKREEEREKLEAREAAMKAEEERRNLINREKDFLNNCYGEAMKDLDERITIAKERKEELQKIIDGTSDVNCNELETDSEGNLLSTMYEKQTDNPTTQSQLTCASHVIENYDENSNPFPSEQDNVVQNSPKPEMTKSASYRTVASEEAQRNKCKVLKSEFGLLDNLSPKPPTRQTKPKEMTDLEKNRKRVLQSEYDIIPKLELPATRGESISLLNSNPSYDNFKTITIGRKLEYMDLNSPPKCEPEQSQSSESWLSSNDSSDKLSMRESSSGSLREKYQDALTRDAEIFRNKNFHRSIFCELKKNESLTDYPCTNFLKFERYLRKSAWIPLEIQERLANDALLNHLLKEEKLLSHLNSLRAFFFLNDGEFGRSFTHNIFRSLSKCTEPTQFFEKGNLSNIVNEALNYSIHNAEQKSQNLSFRIVKMPPFLNHSSHDVLSPFELTFKVGSPLNLILTERVLTKYKMVFRFLLKLKRISWTLNENFLCMNSHFKNKKLDRNALTASFHYHKIQIFRHAMAHMLLTLDEYIFSSGIQLPWLSFLKELETTQNIEELYQKHINYITEVLSRCFLTRNSEDLLDCIHNLIELALRFHYTAKSSSLVLTNGRYEHPKFSALNTTFREFCSVLKTFLNTLKEKIHSNKILFSHYVLIEKFDFKLT